MKTEQTALIEFPFLGPRMGWVLFFVRDLSVWSGWVIQRRFCVTLALAEVAVDQKIGQWFLQSAQRIGSGHLGWGVVGSGTATVC